MIDDIHSFWFGELDETGCATKEKSARWWKKSDAFDEELRKRFTAHRKTICEDGCEEWLATPRGRLAYVIAIDQFSRNMYRSQPEMYVEDKRALKVVLEGIEAGCHEELGFHERQFLYMPLMHSEDVAAQERGVALFAELAAAFPGKADAVKGLVGYAEQHRDIVVRFGRFPHRNEILGRESTPEEIAFLEEPGSSF